MAKDRAAPFSRKHRKVWIPVTGGMILIGIVNLAVGYCSYDPPPPQPPEKIELVIPPPTPLPDAIIYGPDNPPPDAPPPLTPSR